MTTADQETILRAALDRRGAQIQPLAIDDDGLRAEQHRRREAGERRVLGIGVAFNMPGACYLVSIAELAEQAPPTTVWLPAILLFNVIMFLPGEIPLALYLRDPDSVMQRVDATRTWLRHHAVQLARIMFVVVGLYLYARALMGH